MLLEIDGFRTEPTARNLPRRDSAPRPRRVDGPGIERAVREILVAIGENPDRDDTRLMRDEVFAEFKDDGGAVSLHVYCHVSGGVVYGTARMRNNILHHHMRMVLESLRYGGRELVSACPRLDQAKVQVHFASNHVRYNQVEDWGLVKEYAIEG